VRWPSSSPAASKVGRAVKGRDTKWEVATRSRLWRLGLRFRKNWRALSGSPDMAFRGARLAVFLDGCFWHGCPDHCKAPKSNRELWEAKLRRNRERDAEVDARLAEIGWRSLRVWSHEADPVAVILRYLAFTGDAPRLADG